MAVTFGATATVDASATDSLAACQLTSSLSLVVYERAGNYKARTVTIGAPLVVNAETDIAAIFSFPINLVRVTDTSAMLLSGDSVSGKSVRMLTVAGTTVTSNADTDLSDSRAERYGLSRIDATNVLCSWTGGNLVRAVVLSIAGTTITENTIKDLQSGFAAQGSTCVAFSTTKGLVTWFNADHFGMIVDMAGTTITTNAVKTIDTASGASTGDEMVFSYYQARMTSTLSVYGHGVGGAYRNYALTLNGATFDIGSALALSGDGGATPRAISGAKTTDTAIVIVRQTSATVYTAEGFILSGDTLTSDSSDTKTVTTTDWLWCAAVDGSNILVHFEIASTGVALVSFTATTHLWLSTDGGATYTDIGDSAWGANVVGGVVVVPGTAYQTIFAAVGTDLYKTTNGGTAWSLETAVGYEVDFIDLEKDNTTVFLAKRDAAGTNRASLWDSVGASLTHINTGKSTTGGATSGGDVV